MKVYIVLLKNGSEFLIKGHNIIYAIQSINEGLFDYSFIKSVTEFTTK